MIRGPDGRSIMDKPLTPAEQLADAVSSLTLSLEKLRDALDTLQSLACKIIVTEGHGQGRR